MKARQHHYLSQCYLRGFTKGNSKKSKLSVIDLKEERKFETTPRNVGGLRDFNRIEIEGVDQNQVENDLSKFEGKVASALKKLNNTGDFSGDTKVAIIKLIALLAIRSPEQRESMRKSEAEVAEKLMGLSLSSKKLWASQVEKLSQEPDCPEPVTFKEAREFYDSKEYRIEMPREMHIQNEFEQIKVALPCLFERNWVLVQSTKETGPFITTDKPVSLTWNEPEKVSALLRSSPGIGLGGTQIYFPVSKNYALIGKFGQEDGGFEGDNRVCCYV